MRDIEYYIKQYGNGKEVLTNGTFGRKYTENEAERILEVYPIGSVDTKEITDYIREKYPERYMGLPFYRPDFDSLDSLVFNKNRLTFPIRSNLGRPLGFCGRISVEEESNLKAQKKQYSKYKLTAGIEKKAMRLLFWLDICKQELKTAGAVYIVEGFFDAISMWVRGYTNVIALMGIGLTGDMVDTLKAYGVTEYYMVLDSDDAGIRALERNLHTLQVMPVTTKAIVLPKGEDPDSYIMGGETTPFDDPRDAMRSP